MFCAKKCYIQQLLKMAPFRINFPFLSGVIDEIILEGKSVHKPSGEFKKDKTFINGLPDYQLQIREHIKVWAVQQIIEFSKVAI